MENVCSQDIDNLIYEQRSNAERLKRHKYKQEASVSRQPLADISQQNQHSGQGAFDGANQIGQSSHFVTKQNDKTDEYQKQRLKAPTHQIQGLKQLYSPAPKVWDIDKLYGRKDLLTDAEEIGQWVNFLLVQETQLRPYKYYIENVQKDINSQMRIILTDWMLQVGREFNLQNQTIYYAVNYLDRWLSKVQTIREDLQLVGTAAIFLACKMEETKYPALKSFSQITDCTWTENEVNEKSFELLDVLMWDTWVITSYSFLPRYIRAAQAPLNSDNLQAQLIWIYSEFFCDIALLNYDLQSEKCSSIAVAAASLGRTAIGYPPWSVTMQAYTGLEWAQVAQIARQMHAGYVQVFQQQQRHEGIIDKYSHSDKQRIAKLGASVPLHPKYQDENWQVQDG